jgi:prolyl-tRNA synthetase
MKRNAPLPDINQDFAGWYHDIVFRAQLADEAPVRGCMVMRPYGCALWEEITRILDKKIKDTGHANALFPLLIPESFLKREAKHVEGFSPELAVVTHAGGKALEEPLVVRPTSETIIHHMFARWIHSWRDLPLKINQWGSVVRWEMRSRPFLRTTEFWWQEGHTAHATEAEAREEVYSILEQYRDLIENYLAIPVITGRKTEKEKFAGADFTTTLESMMPDGRALQMGTSHGISQTFAHAFDMKFQDQQGSQAYPYLTSWAVSTRLIGGLIMVHGDQKGLILPPRIAPIQVIIIPIVTRDNSAEIVAAAEAVARTLRTTLRVKIDTDMTTTPGAKFYESELQGIPLRIEIGKRDLENKSCMVVERLTGSKQQCRIEELLSLCVQELEKLQRGLFERAQVRRAQHWFKVTTLAEIAENIDTKRGFYETSWCQQQACENRLSELRATVRCILDGEVSSVNTCFSCNAPATVRIIVARAY